MLSRLSLPHTLILPVLGYVSESLMKISSGEKLPSESVPESEGTVVQYGVRIWEIETTTCGIDESLVLWIGKHMMID